jgi:hypothetical protein
MMVEWISVKDKLPEESSVTPVLVHGPALARQVRGGIVGYGVYSEKLDEWKILGSINSPFRIREVTHWAPMPEPPKGE